jgi:hypothetical protein
MSAVVYAVAVKRPTKTGSTSWFWNRTEADSAFFDRVDEYGETSTVAIYRIDLADAIGEAVEDSISAGEAELLKIREPEKPEKPEYTTLRYDTQDHNILYIERTFGGEFWAYTVEKRGNHSWSVFEDGQRIGRIYQDDPTALLPSYTVELRADTDPVGYGASLQEAVEKLIGTVSGDFGDVK